MGKSPSPNQQGSIQEVVLNVHWKDWCCRWSSNPLTTWCKELTHWKRPWCWERLKTGGEGDDRGWDGWMASPTQWTWVWASSGRWWRTGKPGVPRSMGSQRVWHEWSAEQQHDHYSTQSLSCVRFFATLWTVACQAPLCMGFPRQEYWSGLPCPPPGHLSDSGIKPKCPEAPTLAGRFFTTEPPEKPTVIIDKNSKQCP